MDGHFVTPGEFAYPESVLKEMHTDRFGTDSLRWLSDEAGQALEDGAGRPR